MKYILLVVVLIAIGVVGYSVFENKQSAENVMPVPVVTNTPEDKGNEVVQESTTTQTTPVLTVKTFTMAEVALHADSASCYSVVNGAVYDLTNWITKHPGGQQAIKSICGKDGTAAFMGKHGGDARPEATLLGFKIGVLAQ